MTLNPEHRGAGRDELALTEFPLLQEPLDPRPQIHPLDRLDAADERDLVAHLLPLREWRRPRADPPASPAAGRVLRHKRSTVP